MEKEKERGIVFQAVTISADGTVRTLKEGDEGKEESAGVKVMPV